MQAARDTRCANDDIVDVDLDRPRWASLADVHFCNGEVFTGYASFFTHVGAGHTVNADVRNSRAAGERPLCESVAMQPLAARMRSLPSACHGGRDDTSRDIVSTMSLR